MFEIIFDSETINLQCNVADKNLQINTYEPDPKIKFNNPRNIINIKYDVDNSQSDIAEKILNAETTFLNALFSHKNFSKDFCWITTLGKKKLQHQIENKEIDSNGKNFEYNKNIKNNLNLQFNDNLKIEFNNKSIDIEEFKKICEHKIINLDLKLSLYALIYTTKDNINITIITKVKEIKVLELKEKLSHLFQIEKSNTTNTFEYFQKFPTGKKKAVQNILQILTTDSMAK